MKITVSLKTPNTLFSGNSSHIKGSVITTIGPIKANMILIPRRNVLKTALSSFLLISILLGVSEHFVTSSVFAVIAFMIKPQSIVIFPIIGFLVIRDVVRRRKEDRAV